jgi:hypothetical protein
MNFESAVKQTINGPDSSYEKYDLTAFQVIHLNARCMILLSVCSETPKSGMEVLQ